MIIRKYLEILLLKTETFRFLLKQLGSDEKLALEHRFYRIMTSFYNFFKTSSTPQPNKNISF